jgi:hypothetical protein
MFKKQQLYNIKGNVTITAIQNNRKLILSPPKENAVALLLGPNCLATQQNCKVCKDRNSTMDNYLLKCQVIST